MSASWIAREEKEMPDRSVFISSCSRRQLARRRGTRSLLRLQLLVAAVILAAAFGAYVAGRGGI
jgi:hypothetical protein